MKKTIRNQAFLIMFSLVGISFASCSSDDNYIEPNKPVTLEDINGAYTGKAITVQGRYMNEVNTPFLVKNEVLSFDAFPVTEIVGSVTKDDKKTEEALKTLGPVEYDIDFKATLNSTKTVVEFTFTPKPLVLKVAVDGTTKDVIATLSAKKKGAFITRQISVLGFELDVEKLSVDGQEESKFMPIKYVFPGSAKKSK